MAIMVEESTLPEVKKRSMTRYLHYFRIAVSVFFVVLTVLLCVWWVRSYSRMDVLAVPYGNWGAGGFLVTSQRGTIGCMDALRIVSLPLKSTPSHSVDWSTYTPDSYRWPIYSHYVHSAQLRGHSIPVGLRFLFPIWSLAVVCAIVAALPWFPYSRRFSLRTLLIGTTLVAVMMGLVVWLTRT